MSKAEKKAMQCCCTKCANNKLNCGMKLISHGRNCIACSNFIEGYHQAEKDIKKELSDLFQEFTLDCINDNKDIHILHFMDVFKNKLKTIGNE